MYCMYVSVDLIGEMVVCHVTPLRYSDGRGE